MANLYREFCDVWYSYCWSVLQDFFCCLDIWLCLFVIFVFFFVFFWFSIIIIIYFQICNWFDDTLNLFKDYSKIVYLSKKILAMKTSLAPHNFSYKVFIISNAWQSFYSKYACMKSFVVENVINKFKFFFLNVVRVLSNLFKLLCKTVIIL